MILLTPCCTHGVNWQVSHPVSRPQIWLLLALYVVVLVLLARGYPIKTVSRMLNISVATAKTHACTLYQRLHVKNKGEAVYAALQRGATLEWHDPNGRDTDAGQIYGRKLG